MHQDISQTSAVTSNPTLTATLPVPPSTLVSIRTTAKVRALQFSSDCSCVHICPR